MAFTAGQNTSDRTRTAIAVTFLEALAIYAIVSALTVKFTKETETIIQGRNIPAPRPTPSPPPDRHEKQIDHPPIPLPTDLPQGPIDIDRTGPLVPPLDAGPWVPANPTPGPDTLPHHPASIASAPHPRGHPGDWVSPGDYPSQDIREGNQGTVRFQLDVSPQGRVTGCRITASSGFPRLDAAACAKLTARARFDPAVDANGAKVAGTYASAVRWTIPE